MSWVWLDIAAVIVLLCFIHSRGKQGFASAVVGLVSVVGSMIGAYLLAPYLSRLLYRTVLREQLLGRVAEGLAGAGAEDSLLNQALAAIAALPEPLAYALGLDAGDLNRQLGQIPQTAGGMAEGLLDVVIEPAVLAMLEMFLSFLVFLVLLFLLHRLARSMQVLQRVPVIGPVNRLLGMGVGLLEGLVLLYLAALLLQLAFALSSSHSLWIFTPDSLHQSYILGGLLRF